MIDKVSHTEDIELLTIKNVAELLKISPTSVRRLQQGRHIPFIKVGGSVRFAKNDVVAYLKRNRIESMH
jgi:excisionase family DNA binding protein